METAYVLILIAFSFSVLLGAITTKNLVSIGLPMLVPIIFTMGNTGAKGWDFDTLLFVSPFLVAGAIWYSIIGYVGTKLGRKIRKLISRGERNEVQ
jgi:hypothetical protein